MDLAGASDPVRRRRSSSATSSSTELECVFFSCTPSSGSKSRIMPGFTSSSRASSLILIFFIEETAKISPCTTAVWTSQFVSWYQIRRLRRSPLSQPIPAAMRAHPKVLPLFQDREFRLHLFRRAKHARVWPDRVPARPYRSFRMPWVARLLPVPLPRRRLRPLCSRHLRERVHPLHLSPELRTRLRLPRYQTDHNKQLHLTGSGSRPARRFPRLPPAPPVSWSLSVRPCRCSLRPASPQYSRRVRDRSELKLVRQKSPYQPS